MPIPHERVAVFRTGSETSCVSNVCRHQVGPCSRARSSFPTGLDGDALDEIMHHILITDTRTREVVATCRMQTAAMAAANGGFYTAGEFDLSGIPLEMVEDAVEVGRARIAKEHRSRRVLHLLWRGLAVYLTWTGKHVLFGCCSLTTQDGRIGNEVHSRICGPPAIDREFRTIDFLVVLDVRELEPHVHRGFFR